MGRKSDARKRLIDAGHELIWGQSYGAVRIETICERAGVRKGSFYYFFESKSDLVVAAINDWWDEHKIFVQECFHPQVPPLERLVRYLDSVALEQMEAYRETGKVLGCPLFTLASEICLQDERIRTAIQEILDHGPRYFGEAIRDAQAVGQLDPGNPQNKTRLLWAYYEGTLSRARIENDPGLVQNLSSDALELIGANCELLTTAVAS